MALDVKKLRRFIGLMAWWPPYLGTGLTVDKVNETATSYQVSMKLRFYNRNIYGSHFGGSLYSMCDPWYAFAASAYFGDGYIIWDKSASIKYLSPGKGKVTGLFEIPVEQLAAMKAEVDATGKKTYTFVTDITDQKQTVVAEVTKEIYIRKKQ